MTTKKTIYQEFDVDSLSSKSEDLTFKLREWSWLYLRYDQLPGFIQGFIQWFYFHYRPDLYRFNGIVVKKYAIWLHYYLVRELNNQIELLGLSLESRELIQFEFWKPESVTRTELEMMHAYLQGIGFLPELSYMQYQGENGFNFLVETDWVRHYES